LEVLVVDNYSRDETRRIAESEGAKVLWCRGTQAAARNVGLSNSKGRFVLFLDSDQQLEAGVVEECVAACLSSEVEAVKIPEVFVGIDFWGTCSAFWKNRMVKAWGQNGGIPRFYRRNMLLKLSSSFNDKLRYWEDRELHQRLKAAGVKDAWCESYVFHHENGSLQDVTRKYLSYGQSIATFRKKANDGPYFLTVKLTLSAMLGVLRNPGRSLRLLLGFGFLFLVKSLCAAFGFLSSSILSFSLSRP
jgi:glycosyltransferase involved in cell wall biosynthesis